MDECSLPKARPILCNESPAFQRHHMSLFCAAESPNRFPWVINTTFGEKTYIRWCCNDRLSSQRLSGVSVTLTIVTDLFYATLWFAEGKRDGCFLYSHSRSGIPFADSLADLGLGAMVGLKTALRTSWVAIGRGILGLGPSFSYWTIGLVRSLSRPRRSNEILLCPCKKQLSV